MQNFFAKVLFKAFQRAIKSQNPMTESRSKYRFSLEKVKISHSGGVLEDSGSRFKSPALNLMC